MSEWTGELSKASIRYLLCAFAGSPLSSQSRLCREFSSCRDLCSCSVPKQFCHVHRASGLAASALAYPNHWRHKQLLPKSLKFSRLQSQLSKSLENFEMAPNDKKGMKNNCPCDIIASNLNAQPRSSSPFAFENKLDSIQSPNSEAFRAFEH